MSALKFILEKKDKSDKARAGKIILPHGEVETPVFMPVDIPIANTTTVLLGPGTSVTQAAMRELDKAGVMVGFCGEFTRAAQAAQV